MHYALARVNELDTVEHRTRTAHIQFLMLAKTAEISRKQHLNPKPKKKNHQQTHPALHNAFDSQRPAGKRSRCTLSPGPASKSLSPFHAFLYLSSGHVFIFIWRVQVQWLRAVRARTRRVPPLCKNALYTLSPRTIYVLCTGFVYVWIDADGTYIAFWSKESTAATRRELSRSRFLSWCCAVNGADTFAKVQRRWL